MALRTVQLTRVPEGAVICPRCEVAETSRARTVGLLGRSGLEADQGLWINPCNALHTWFMRFAIDTVFLDADLVVLRVYERVEPFRMRACREARSVVELPAGVATAVGLRVGDRLAMVDVPA